MRLSSLLSTLVLCVLVLIYAAPAHAQTPTSVTISVFGSTVTDPNAAGVTAVSSQTYTLTNACGKLPKLTTSPQPIVNPIEDRVDDPADSTKDCVFDVSAQVNALVQATGYQMAVKFTNSLTTSLYGGLAGPFSRVLPLAAPTNHRIRQ